MPTGAEFAAAPLLRPMSYTHDDAGNRTGSDGTGGGTGAAPKSRFVYDAWNRLVEIDTYDGASSTFKISARYDYNGLHWRTRKLAYAAQGCWSSYGFARGTDWIWGV